MPLDRKSRRQAVKLFDRMHSLRLLDVFTIAPLVVWFGMFDPDPDPMYAHLKEDVYDRRKNLDEVWDITTDCIIRFGEDMNKIADAEGSVKMSAILDELDAIERDAYDDAYRRELEKQPSTLRVEATRSFTDVWFHFIEFSKRHDYSEDKGRTYLIDGETMKPTAIDNFAYFRDLLMQRMEDTGSRAVTSRLARLAYVAGYVYKRDAQARRHGETPSTHDIDGWLTVARVHAEHVEEYKVQNVPEKDGVAFMLKAQQDGITYRSATR